jgi:hypothetical protein
MLAAGLFGPASATSAAPRAAASHSAYAAVAQGDRWRFGIAAPLGIGGYDAQLDDLKAGTYINFGNSLSPARPGGIEYIQMLRVRDDLYPNVLSQLPGLVAANPGAYWEVGNEPDTTYSVQDKVTPETYADRYYAIATQIRSLDPSAKIAFGTIVQPSPIRLHYLERAWNQLVADAGSQSAASGLIDIWATHAFILNEWPHEWGTGVPPGFTCETGGQGRCWDSSQGSTFDCNANPDQCWTPVHFTTYPYNETHDNSIFDSRVVAMRQWMKGIGEQDKPLWITEYGVLFPPIDPVGVNLVNVSDSETSRFMTESFDYLLNTTDPNLGLPSDGDHLVQRWFWYSLNDHRYNYGGSLYDPDNSKARTAVGTAWINYVDPPIFADVPIDHWARDYIEALYDAGFVVGCSLSPRLYCPDDILIRAESAVFILRGAYGAIPEPPYPPPATATFSDVSSSYWGYGWIESLWHDGFTAGCGTDPLIFCPLRQHTRAEGSVFFLRIKNGVSYVPPDPVGLFSDVPLDQWSQGIPWYAPWVEAAYNQGLLPACSTNPLKFCPDNPLDRAWAAYMMVQAKGGLPLPTPTP